MNKREFKYCRTRADALLDPRVVDVYGMNDGCCSGEKPDWSTRQDYSVHIWLARGWGWGGERYHEIISGTMREALRELNSNVYPCAVE